MVFFSLPNLPMKQPLLLALLAACPWLASASEALTERPVDLRLSVETLELPGGERMGLLGGTYFFQVAPEVYLGPAVYGAATGQRGGFFTGGFDLAWKKPLTNGIFIRSGLYVGGGGGGSAAVGGGLMLRPSVELGWQGHGYSLGVTGSQVRFPNGQISSRQWGLALSFHDVFAYAPASRAGEAVTDDLRGGVGFDRLSVVGGSYQPDAASRDVNGVAYAGSIGYAGFRADQQWTEHLFWGLESGAAVKGGADGYAEVLGVAGAEYPLLGDRLQLGARLSAGLGGGGRINTQGGVVVKAALGATATLHQGVNLGIEWGRVRAPGGSFDARFASVLLGLDLDDRRPASARTLQGMAWEAKLTRYTSAARYAIPQQAFDTVGLGIQRRINPHLYWTGQALSAVDGQAGGYSMGLVGVGLDTAMPAAGLSTGLELLVGAAGGGGVDTQGGAVVQAGAFVSQALPSGAKVKLGLGRVRSLKGGLDSPLVDLSVLFPFSVPGRP